MERSETINELASALVKAQGEFGAIPKTATNPFFKSKYAALPIVVETASPILATHGLGVSQLLGRDETADTLTTMLVHESGQFIAETMRLYLTKNDAQGQGSATTYARRYAYMSILGLVADEDDDGNKAQQKKSQSVQSNPVRRGPPTQSKKPETNSQRSGDAVAKKADPETGEIIERPLKDLINELDQGRADELVKLLEGRNIPTDVDKLTPGGAKVVRKEVDRLLGEQQLEAPF